jgi:hypothetical protein
VTTAKLQRHNALVMSGSMDHKTVCRERDPRIIARAPLI